MATPPKSTPPKVVTKKVATPVQSVASAAPKAPVAKPVAAKEKPQDKPMPFVIEPESLSAFVDKSDSALPPSKALAEPAPEPVAAKPDAKPEPATPVKAEAVKAAPVEAKAVAAPAPVVTPAKVIAPAAAPVEAKAPEAPKAPPIVEVKASPSQPVVAENKIAAKEQAAKWQAAPNALEGHYIMNEAIETSKKFAEDAKSRLQSLVTDFNEKAKVAAEKSSKAAEEFSDIAKGNLEAIVESSKIAAKGFETLGQSAAEYGRSSFEKTSATLKSFASVKSPTEFFQLQSELFTSAFDALASETAKNSEAVLKLAGEIAQPISNRYAVVSDKLKALAA
ncbi:MAG TPA: TIGR01841 family phasin [Sphingobium sp.]|uniref:phasin family protein n=1 Tax=Sphingobium sp. TaxID=1912891 RepID=UPI002ED0659F